MEKPEHIKDLFESYFWDKLIDYLTCHENLNNEYKEYYAGIRENIENKSYFPFVDFLEINIIVSKECKLKFEEYKNILYHNHKLFHILLKQFQIIEQINKSRIINKNDIEINFSEQFYRKQFGKIIENAKNIEISTFNEILKNKYSYHLHEINNFDEKITFGFIRHEIINTIVYFLLDFILHLKKYLPENISYLVESYYKYDLPNLSDLYLPIFIEHKNKDLLKAKKEFLTPKIITKPMDRVKRGRQGENIIYKEEQEQLLEEYYYALDILGIMLAHNIKNLDECYDFLDELNQDLCSYIFKNRELFFKNNEYTPPKMGDDVAKDYIKEKNKVKFKSKGKNYFDNLVSKAPNNIEKILNDLNECLNIVSSIDSSDTRRIIEKFKSLNNLDIPSKISEKHFKIIALSVDYYLKNKSLENRIAIRNKIREFKWELGKYEANLKGSILFSEFSNYSKTLIYIAKLNNILVCGIDEDDYSNENTALIDILQKLEDSTEYNIIEIL